MKETISKKLEQLELEIIIETNKRFRESVNVSSDRFESKKQFIKWYVNNHNDAIDNLIHDISNYYLFVSEKTIIDYLNEEG